MTLASVVAAPFAGRLASRLGVRPPAALGLVLVGAGLLLMARMSADGGLAAVLSGMVVGEVGIMLSSVPLTIAGSVSVGEDKRGLAAGVLNTSIQVGNALGLAMVAAVVAAASGGEAAGARATVEGFRWGLGAGVGFVAAALLVVLFGLRTATAGEKSPSLCSSARVRPRAAPPRDPP